MTDLVKQMHPRYVTARVFNLDGDAWDRATSLPRGFPAATTVRA
jgi:hypothetical protein